MNIAKSAAKKLIAAKRNAGSSLKKRKIEELKAKFGKYVMGTQFTEEQNGILDDLIDLVLDECEDEDDAKDLALTILTQKLPG